MFIFDISMGGSNDGDVCNQFHQLVHQVDLINGLNDFSILIMKYDRYHCMYMMWIRFVFLSMVWEAGVICQSISFSLLIVVTRIWL